MVGAIIGKGVGTTKLILLQSRAKIQVTDGFWEANDDPFYKKNIKWQWKQF